MWSEVTKKKLMKRRSKEKEKEEEREENKRERKEKKNSSDSVEKIRRQLWNKHGIRTSVRKSLRKGYKYKLTRCGNKQKKKNSHLQYNMVQYTTIYGSTIHILQYNAEQYTTMEQIVIKKYYKKICQLDK